MSYETRHNTQTRSSKSLVAVAFFAIAFGAWPVYAGGERAHGTTEPADFALDNVDDIIGRGVYHYWVDSDSVYEIDSLNLGLFYTDVSGDTSSFPEDSSLTLYSTDGDTIITIYSEFIEADTSLGIVGWKVEISGKKWDELEPPRETGSYWIEVKTLEVHYDTTFNEETVDYYPLGEDAYSIIFYKGESENPDTYREIDVYGPVYVWEFDATTVEVCEERNVLPATIRLNAYPNPFNSAVSITAPAGAEIEIYDIEGRMVDVIASARTRLGPEAAAISSNQGDCFGGQSPSRNDGKGEFTWQPSPSIGSGIYLVRAGRGEQEVTKRIVYLK